MLDDLKIRKNLTEKYPYVFHEVTYEDFMSNPLNGTSAIYDFLGLPVPAAVKTWLKGVGFTSHANNWENSTTLGDASDIDNICRDVYTALDRRKWDTYLF